MLYIIRHGQTGYNIENKIQGIRDIPLNVIGKVQAQHVADDLKDLGIKKIISSDLKRAKETAEIIGRILKLNISFDARIREYDFGRVDGTNHITPELMARFIADPTAFGAEKFEDAFARVDNFLGTIDYNIDTLVVSHGGIMRFMMYWFHNKKFNTNDFISNYFDTRIENVEVFGAQNAHSKMVSFDKMDSELSARLRSLAENYMAR